MIHLFNKVNRGSRVILEKEDGAIEVKDFKDVRHTDKGKRSHEYPYKKFFLCPDCHKPLLGSASRGRSGKYYPAYHCSRGKNHSFRVSKKDLEATVDSFVSKLRLSPQKMEQIFEVLEESFNAVQAGHQNKVVSFEKQITNLELELQSYIAKIKLLSNESTIKSLEQDISSLEVAIAKLKNEKQALSSERMPDLSKLKIKIQHLMNHLGDFANNKLDNFMKAKLFGLLFHRLPTYRELVGGTTSLTGVNSLFLIKAEDVLKNVGGTSLNSELTEVKQLKSKSKFHSIRSGVPDRI